jgi:hypothetical protein
LSGRSVTRTGGGSTSTSQKLGLTTLDALMTRYPTPEERLAPATSVWEHLAELPPRLAHSILSAPPDQQA